MVFGSCHSSAEAIQRIRSTKGKTGVFAIKLHLDKAYDCQGWSYIRDNRLFSISLMLLLIAL